MNPEPINQALRSRLRSVVKSSSNLDVPQPPAPPPPENPPPFSRDRIHNPMNQGWNEILLDLNALEGVFPENLWHKVRRVSHLEHMVSRTFNGVTRRKFPMPCEARDMLAIVDHRLRITRSERPTHTDYCYLTVADYPVWMSNETQRDQAFSEYALTQQFGL